VALADDFKQAMSSWASGVAVVTANDAGMLYGITVSSFTSVSLDPPLVLVCIADKNRMPDMIRRAGCFAVSILSGDQEEASRYFATPGREPTAGFVVVEGGWTALQQPIVKDALAHVVCELHAEHDGGDHVLLIGRVVHAETNPAGSPLLYWRRGYHGLPGA
jgi:flavin reductase (DIM6/NTAB) family NADH-FMN oxidoreductase RutF